MLWTTPVGHVVSPTKGVDLKAVHEPGCELGSSRTLSLMVEL
jgi:hypothetical protein